MTSLWKSSVNLCQKLCVFSVHILVYFSNYPLLTTFFTFFSPTFKQPYPLCPNQDFFTIPQPLLLLLQI